MMNKLNMLHLVTPSPWPLFSSIQLQSTMLSTILMITKNSSKKPLLSNFILLVVITTVWWKNVLKEASEEGAHLNKTMGGIKLGMLMFISSEVLFFTSFFWAYFHSMSSPNVEIGQSWPPKSIQPFNPINVPLLNTMVLISSGFSITWCHHLMMEKNLKNSKKLLLTTCALGVYFSIFQGMEYSQATFSMSDSSYGSIFFMATGFHGIHVLVGTAFLTTNLLLMKKLSNNSNHHMGFELAAWYWHFVDIIWLFLYVSVYWWGK